MWAQGRLGSREYSSFQALGVRLILFFVLAAIGLLLATVCARRDSTLTKSWQHEASLTGRVHRQLT